MGSFREVIDLWPDGQLASDIGQKAVTVRGWRNRNSIPAGYWSAVVAAAAGREFKGVTTDVLSGLARPRRAKAEAA